MMNPKMAKAESPRKGDMRTEENPDAGAAAPMPSRDPGSSRRPDAKEAELERELRHRVGNNLQIMLSLINLQATLTRSGETKAALLTVERRIHSLSFAVDFHISRGAPGSVDALDAVKAYCIRFIEADFSAGRRLMASIKGDGISLKADTAIYLSLLLSELLSNSCIHGSAEGSDCPVDISWTELPDGGARFEYRDHGRGYPAEVLAGQRNELGLSLVEAIAAQVGAEADLANAEDGGAVATLRFPQRPEWIVAAGAPSAQEAADAPRILA
jgi:two-component sensor histidine kinase